MKQFAVNTLSDKCNETSLKKKSKINYLIFFFLNVETIYQKQRFSSWKHVALKIMEHQISKVLETIVATHQCI